MEKRAVALVPDINIPYLQERNPRLRRRDLLLSDRVNSMYDNHHQVKLLVIHFPASFFFFFPTVEADTSA